MSNDKRKRPASNIYNLRSHSSRSEASEPLETPDKPTIKKVKSNTKSNPSTSSIKLDVSSYDELRPLEMRENVRGSLKLNGNNIIHTLHKLQKGVCPKSKLKQIADGTHLQLVKQLQLYSKEEFADVRITAMQWHPKHPFLYLIGGKYGSLRLFKIMPKLRKLLQLYMFPGLGAGGTIEAIKFDPGLSEVVAYTASVDGTVSTYNFETPVSNTLIHSMYPEREWFCAVDLHQDGKRVFAGDSKGRLATYTLDSGKTNYFYEPPKLHSSKIKHLEFSARDPNIMVTASLDKCVKMWDIRNLTESLFCLKHTNGVSSATFSLTDGCRLLTTDVKDEVRVYQGPSWQLEHTIKHPHRAFQHLTTIKASWHTQADLILIGRYPDNKMPEFDEEMAVDVFSAATGQLQHEIIDINKRLITSRAHFNCSGTILATTSGRIVHLWGSDPCEGCLERKLQEA